MKILEQTQHRLVLDLRPVGLMILCLGLGVMFLALGFGTGAIMSAIARMVGFPGAEGLDAMPGSFGTNLIGYAAVIPLLVAVFFIKARRLTFDRGAGTIRIDTRGLLGRGSKDYPMAAFQGASLAASRSGNNGTTYRAILHFSDANAMVGVTPYGTSGSGPARMVNAINGWFGTPISGTGAMGSGPSSGPGVVLSGPQAAEALAALEKLGIKIPR